MNAISPLLDLEADDRKALRLRQCAQLIALGMELAELAADRAREQLTADPSDSPDPAGEAEATPPPLRGRDPVIAFTRLSRCVQSLIAQEDRLATSPPPGSRAQSEPDPPDHGIEDVDAFVRTCALNEALFRTSRTHPNRWNISQETEAVVEKVVTDLPHLPLRALFEQAALTLGFEPDLSGLTPYLREEIYPDTS